jgi:hypothetical protein
MFHVGVDDDDGIHQDSKIQEAKIHLPETSSTLQSKE